MYVESDLSNTKFNDIDCPKITRTWLFDIY